MHSLRAAFVVIGLVAVAPAARAGTVLVTSLGDMTTGSACPSPATCTLRRAILDAAPGDTIAFDPAFAYPATITLSGTAVTIDKDLVIDGPGPAALAITVSSFNRVFAIGAGSVTLRGLTLGGGRRATSNGMNGASGTGQNGASAAVAEGGCLRVAAGATLALDRIAITDCLARGGTAGSGGSGPGGTTGESGGAGGSGGGALGGAIAVFGTLSMVDSSIHASVAEGGDGGAGGSGGNGVITDGDGGDGGNGGVARGAAIFVASGGALLVRNSTLTGNTADAGRGGNGGNAGGSNVPGGDGGDGAGASGGQVYLESALSLADIEFASLGPAQMVSGLGGNPGGGGLSATAGMAGSSAGEVLVALTMPRVRASVLVGSGNTTDCQGNVTASGANMDSDNSCSGFTVQGSVGANFAGPAVQIESGRAVLRPIAGSLAIDAATNCRDLAAAIVASDQSGRARPIDGDASGTAACDLGAVEYSQQILADGFEG